LRLLLARLLVAHDYAARDITQLTAVRPATRAELYRRLHLARDYILACSHQPLSLDDIARVACLSPNHLLRTFKQLFGQTPHQFLMAQRLQQARRLLLQTDWTITDICLMVGYASLSSFSGLFRQHFHTSPQAYRDQNR
jgi:AraC family transcriptional regulator